MAFRDLNGNGVMDPYEDPQLSVAERVDDLISRMSLPEKVGLMFHTVIEAGSARAAARRARADQQVRDLRCRARQASLPLQRARTR